MKDSSFFVALEKLFLKIFFKNFRDYPAYFDMGENRRKTEVCEKTAEVKGIVVVLGKMSFDFSISRPGRLELKICENYNLTVHDAERSAWGAPVF